MPTPALFLDRDGIFNEVVFRDGGHHSPRNWQEVKHYPLEGLTTLKQFGIKLVMITNQPDIERKIISENFITELHEYYKTTYQLDNIYVCPFSSNDHPLKKPNPGMFLLAKKELNIDLLQSFHLGDTERDTIAAARCGISTILWTRNYNKELKSDFRVGCIQEIVNLISKRLNLECAPQ